MIPSLCQHCQFVRIVKTPQGAEYLLCQKWQTDKRFAKYPPQPVLACAGFQPGNSSPPNAKN